MHPQPSSEPLLESVWQFPFDEAILPTYVGEYQLNEAFSIVVTHEGGQLFGQATGQDKFPMFAESERSSS